MTQLKLIIFDMDGVLVDSEKFYMKSELQVIQSFGKEASEDYLRSFCGTTQDFIWGSIKKDFALDISLEDLKIKAKNQLIYLFETEEIEAIEHVEKTLSNLKKAGYLLAVASSSEREIIKRHLIELDFLKYFDLITSSEEVAHSKPAPDVFIAVAEELKVPTEHVIVIEDSTNGIKAAKNAEMICIGYNNLNYPPINQEAADIIISNMSEITPEFLEELVNKK